MFLQRNPTLFTFGKIKIDRKPAVVKSDSGQLQHAPNPREDHIYQTRAKVISPRAMIGHTNDDYTAATTASRYGQVTLNIESISL